MITKDTTASNQIKTGLKPSTLSPYTMGNEGKFKQYFIGLDVGTNSVGWAVADADYNILRHK